MDNLRQLAETFNQSTLKKLVLIIIGGVVVITIMLFILALGQKKPVPKQVLPPIPVFSPPASPKPVGPIIPTPKPFEATTSASPLQGLSVSFPVIKDNFIYYLSDGGSRFYKTSLDGRNKQPISDHLVARIEYVVWSPDKSSVILKVKNNKYSLGKNNSPFFSPTDENLAITNWYYNFTDKSIRKLDSKIVPIAYSPNGDKIAYIKADEKQNLNRLYIANPDGSNEQFVTTLPEVIQDNLVFLDNNSVLTYPNPEGYGKNFIYLINLSGKTIQKITEDGFTFGTNPSSKGNLFLAQTVKQDPEVFYKKFLSIVNVQNRTTTILGIPTNLNLSAWSSDGNTIYAFEANRLWIVDANSLNKNTLDLPAEFANLKIDEGSVMVSPDNSTIFFTANGKLYSFQIR